MFREVAPTDQEVEEDYNAPRVVVRDRPRDSFDQDLADVANMIQDAHQDDPHLKIAFYGQPGVGKSWLAASFPDPLIIDCHEEGSKFLPKSKFAGVKVFNAKRLQDVELMYWYLREGKHSFKTVVIDTVSSLIEMGLKYMLVPDDDEWQVSRNPAMPSQRLWGQSNANIGQLLWYLVELPMNVIFLAHERRRASEEEDADINEDYAAPIVFPDLNPGLQRRLYGSVDIMGRMVMKEVDIKSKTEGEPPTKRLARILYLAPSPVYQAKDRTDVLPKYIVDPTYQKLERPLRRLQEEVS